MQFSKIQASGNRFSWNKVNLTSPSLLNLVIFSTTTKAAESGNGKHPDASASIDSSKYMCQVFYQKREVNNYVENNTNMFSTSYVRCKCLHIVNNSSYIAIN